MNDDDKIGFYSLLPSRDEKGHLGALLITDTLGKPQEFRVTYPVKPTLLQRQLYGDSLIPHIGIELCGIPLFKELNNKPILLMVADTQFLGLAQTTSCSVAYIERLGETMHIDDGESSGNIQEKINHASGRFQPLLCELPPGSDESEHTETIEQISRFFLRIDLLEPFDRIRVAIDALAEQKPEFS
jgi:hypothetical protein